MLEILRPPRPPLRLKYLALDVNGTLALDGQLLPGARARLTALSAALEIWLISADTYGALAQIAAELPAQARRLTPGNEAAQKAAWLNQLGAAQTVAIGNGANDAAMLRAAALSMAVLGPEGLAQECLQAAQIVVPHIDAALDLLLHPRRVTATLRA